MSLPSVPMSQTPEEKFREYLSSRPRPQRYTGQQRALVRHIFEQHNHFDAEQLMEALRRASLRVSRATVYRALLKLVDAGLLRRMELASRTYYEHDYGYPPHEHLVCERCNGIFEFESAELNALLERVCGDRQFQSAGHTLIVRGVCRACNAARVAKRRLDLI